MQLIPAEHHGGQCLQDLPVVAPLRPELDVEQGFLDGLWRAVPAPEYSHVPPGGVGTGEQGPGDHAARVSPASAPTEHDAPHRFEESPVCIRQWPSAKEEVHHPTNKPGAAEVT